MKILHTSDWHIGKRLGTVSRLPEQQQVLDEICAIADEKNVDAVVIAGDLFDTYNPPIEAIELFYSTIKKLSKQGERPVIAIAGNHDSPDRIEAPNPLARDNGVFLFGYPKSEYPNFKSELDFNVSQVDAGFIEFSLKNAEKLRVIVAPFANEHRMKEAFLQENEENLVNSLQLFWKNIADNYCDSTGVNILVGHHLMLPTTQTEIEEPDGEKPIQSISELLPPSIVPKQIQYVALGHLHRFQTIRKKSPIVYAGSPCAYSFSEAMQKKHIAIVEVTANSETVVNQVELQTARLLIKKKCESVQDALQWLEKHQNCFVELTIKTDTFLTPSETKSLFDMHEGIIYLIPDVQHENEISQESNIRSQDRPITELFNEYFEHKKGQKPNEEIKLLFKEILGS